MDNFILVNLNIFSKNSQVLIAGPEGAKDFGVYDIEQLPAVLAQLAHESQTYSIKIAGSGKYAQLIEYGIETAEMAKYNENKIEIEVIE